MKKILIVLLGIISLVSDIFGIMSGFKEFFTGKGISPEVASNLNTFLVCFFTIILVIIGIVMGIQYYLRRFGTRKIPCTLYAYYYYRIANKPNITKNMVKGVM
ncbi:MAG: hypothetical protein IJ804_07295 [Prevotella sp.]|nr:hypothetical protein [Prevotella sp.]